MTVVHNIINGNDGELVEDLGSLDTSRRLVEDLAMVA